MKKLNRASSVLSDFSTPDGKVWWKLSRILSSKSDGVYVEALQAAAAQLADLFNSDYESAGSLLPELPPSARADVARLEYNYLGRVVNRLNAARKPRKVALLLDRANARLEQTSALIEEAMIVPFPEDIDADTLSAKINGITLRTSSTLSTLNSFEAVFDGSNGAITCNAVDGFTHGLLFSVPDLREGTTRYSIPQEAVLYYRTNIVSDNQTSIAATNGAIFVSIGATETYGVITCTGPGFEVVNGKFRITLLSE